METHKLTDEFSVSGQLLITDLPTVAAQGYRSLICNRPDGEAPDQPGYEEITAAAEKNGLAVRYLPVVSGKVTDEQALAFRGLLAELPKPVLAYCRSGTRSATLWALTEAPVLTSVASHAASATAARRRPTATMCIIRS
jgi:sulfide:quinone oxidoreductase